MSLYKIIIDHCLGSPSEILRSHSMTPAPRQPKWVHYACIFSHSACFGPAFMSNISSVDLHSVQGKPRKLCKSFGKSRKLFGNQKIFEEKNMKLGTTKNKIEEIK